MKRIGLSSSRTENKAADPDARDLIGLSKCRDLQLLLVGSVNKQSIAYELPDNFIHSLFSFAMDQSKKTLYTLWVFE